MDWLDLPAVKGTLKSLLQHHSSKASILRRSAFFTVFDLKLSKCSFGSKNITFVFALFVMVLVESIQQAFRVFLKCIHIVGT